MVVLKPLKGDIKYMEESRIKLVLNDAGVIIVSNNDEQVLTIVADTKNAN
jgi:hypothetical protein